MRRWIGAFQDETMYILCLRECKQAKDTAFCPTDGIMGIGHT